VIDRHQQPRLAQGVNRRHQCRDLCWRVVIASEQDDATDLRMAQQFALFGTQLQPFHTQHYRS